MNNKNKKSISVKNINYKNTAYRLISCVILLGISVQSANADPYKYKKGRTTAYVSIGQAEVEANELVYCQPINGCPADYKLSQLIWETSSIAMLVAGLNFSVEKSYSMNIEGKFGLTDGKGVMDDYDWQYINLDWSDWSHHEDTIITESTGWDLHLDVGLYANKKTNLSLLIGYREETWAWESRGGTYIYSDTDIPAFRDLSGSFTEGQRVISYEQHFAMPYIGLKFETRLNNWKFNAQYDYSNKVDVSAIDYHHLRDLTFEDDFDAGEMSAYKIGIGYQFSKNFDVYFKYDAQVYEEVRGSTSYTTTSTGTYQGGCVNCAGADNSNQTLSIGVLFVY